MAAPSTCDTTSTSPTPSPLSTRPTSDDDLHPSATDVDDDAREATKGMLSLAREGRHLDALLRYKALLRRRHVHPFYTLPVLLKSCAALLLPSAASQLHARALKAGAHLHPHVLTSLISAYSRLRLPLLASRLFLLDSPRALPASYNALISGLSLNSMPRRAFSLFRLMLRSRVPFGPTTMLSLLPSCCRCAPSLRSAGEPLHALVLKSGTCTFLSVSNALLTMYARSGAVVPARQLFDTMPQGSRDVVTWNAIVSAYSQNGMAAEVLDLYRQMSSAGFEVDPVAIVGVLSSCASLGATHLAREVDSRIQADPSLRSNLFVGNALINVHARCGDLGRARQVFDAMPNRTVVTWTGLISGYGMHGLGDTAVQLFESMLDSGIRPDGIVMLSVLSACSHAGLTDKGMGYFFGMGGLYGLVPRVEHYACMVDLLGRAGRLDEAWDLIQSMPMQPDGAVWGSLLGACKIHRHVRMAELAFEHVVKLEPTNVGYYVLLSNVYTEAGLMDGIARVRRMMKQQGLRKEPGCSYVEHNQRIHLFLADDKSHPQTEAIYRMLVELEGLVTQKDCISVEEAPTSSDRSSDVSENDGLTRAMMAAGSGGYHSEKLAIAFALLNTEAGSRIVMMKNLRVCGDCHRFIKLISGLVDREFLVRDASRFHHFKGSTCSCKDYW